MFQNKYLTYVFTAFPAIIVIILVFWYFDQYKSAKLSQRLTALQILDLEKKMGVNATGKLVEEKLGDNILVGAVNKTVNYIKP